MLFRLILLFTITPIVELFLLLRLADKTSLWTTLVIVLFTGIVGAFLAKSQGRLILTQIRLELNSGKMPGDQLINGLCVLIGGALLLTPGILTDIIGFGLVIPVTRELFKGVVKKYLEKKINKGNIHIDYREL